MLLYTIFVALFIYNVCQYAQHCDIDCIIKVNKPEQWECPCAHHFSKYQIVNKLNIHHKSQRKHCSSLHIVLDTVIANHVF